MSALRDDATALDAVSRLLAPEHSRDGRRHAYAVLPRRRRPRYLVPTAGVDAGAAHIRPARSGGDPLRARALPLILRWGAARALPGPLVVPDGDDDDPSLRRHLGQLVGRDDIEVAVALGGPRPNRKPVLQVLAGGRTVAWAKVGVDDHTDALVSHEAQALAGRRPGPPVVTPTVVAVDRWRGHPLLVLGHLTMAETADDLNLTAEVIAAIAGPPAAEEVRSSRWLRALRASAEVDGTDPSGAVRGRLDALAASLGDRVWPFGAWHGDLAPWNATWAGDELVVWDWERAWAPVPVGLDLVHNRLQTAMLRRGETLAEAVAEAVVAEAPTLVALGYHPDDVALLVSGYLATLRVRYAEDARDGSLGPGATVAAALDAELDAELGAGDDASTASRAGSGRLRGPALAAGP